MRVFKELRTDGYVFFGKTKLDLDYKGVTVIQAVNLDARKDRSSTNGAGKSLLMGLVPEIFYDSVPSGKDVKTQKMRRAGGVTVKVGDTTYDLDRVWGSKKDFSIRKDGKDTQVRTLALAAERAQQIIGLSEEEFYTTAYIDVNRAHPLIRGTSSQRQDYFTSMFRLHDVDHVRKLLLQELREAETAGSTYKELVGQFEAMRGTTSASAIRELKEEKANLEKAAQRFVDLSSKYSEVQEIIEFADNNAKQIARVASICDPKDIEERLNQSKKLLKHKRKDLEQVIAYKQERKLIKAAEEERSAAIARLQEQGLPTKAKAARKGSQKYKAAKEELESVERDLNRSLAELEDAKAKAEPLYEIKAVRKAAKNKDNPPKVRIAKLEIKIERLRHEQEHAKKFKKGECPTCGQEVKARSSDEIQEELREAKKDLQVLEQANTLVEVQNVLDNLEGPVSELENAVGELKARVDKYRPYHEAHKVIKDLRDVPEATVEKPKLDREELEKDIQALETEVEVLTRAADSVQMYVMAHKLTDEERTWAKETRARLKKLELKASRLTVVESQIVQEEDKLKTLRRVRDKALGLKDKASDVPIIKALLEIYSNKVLKKLMIQRYASVIEDQLNKFRSIMFSEDFSFELIYDTKFHILCHRKYGKKVITSDVRKLSGAEGRGFTLLLLLALLTLVPKSRRLNFLVLDEADSNMGPDMLANFKRFIPILNKVIPHIVVVTPKPDVSYDGARYFTIVKENGRSRLIKRKVGCA